jgi:thiol:disulfide interchange protein DsbC
MLRGVQPQRPLGQCVTPLDRNAALSQRLRVRGTPAIFFEDGTRLPGYAAAAQIEQRLDRARSAPRASR